MLKKCIICNKEFKTFKSIQHKKKFCSSECRKKTTHIESECIICGKKYEVAKSRYNGKFIRHKCCSDNCYKKYKKNIELEWRNKNTYICLNCGITFIGIRNGKTNLKFCTQECSKIFMKGENSFAFKNGWTINSAGYRCIKVGNKYLYEHRIVMEEFLNRKLKKDEVVHHKDKNKLNNCIENLQLMTKKEHDRLHTELRNGK